MAVEAERQPFEALAQAAEQVAASGDLRAALAAVAAAAAEALGAQLVVLRVLDTAGDLVVRAVAPATSGLAAEVAGTRADCELLVAGEASAAVRRAADHARAEGVLGVAALAGGRIVGSVEAVRHEPFDDDAASVAGLVAAQLALAVRTLAPGPHAAAGARRLAWLELAGEALAAGSDPRRAAEQGLRVAVEATGARGGGAWRVGPEGELSRLAAFGDVEQALAENALDLRQPVLLTGDAGLPDGIDQVATLPLGQPPFAVLQLFYAVDASP